MSQANLEHFAEGSVHGRFQPCHKGHLEYILAAFERCDFIYVGITQYLRNRLIQTESPGALHRGRPQNNPLTYFERAKIIENVLCSEGIGRDRFDITPFPIEEPVDLEQFVPNSVMIFTTTYDEWNKAKIDKLKEQGYGVKNLWTREHKEFVGGDIRQQMASGDLRWRESVPPAAAEILDDLDLGERLRNLELPESG